MSSLEPNDGIVRITVRVIVQIEETVYTERRPVTVHADAATRVLVETAEDLAQEIKYKCYITNQQRCIPDDLRLLFWTEDPENHNEEGNLVSEQAFYNYLQRIVDDKEFDPRIDRQRIGGYERVSDWRHKVDVVGIAVEKFQADAVEQSEQQQRVDDIVEAAFASLINTPLPAPVAAIARAATSSPLPTRSQAAQAPPAQRQVTPSTPATPCSLPDTDIKAAVKAACHLLMPRQTNGKPHWMNGRKPVTSIVKGKDCSKCYLQEGE